MDGFKDLACQRMAARTLSNIRITLTQIARGTRLTFSQSGIPDEFEETISKGWRDFYWTLLKRTLETKQ